MGSSELKIQFLFEMIWSIYVKILCQILWFSSSYSGFPHTGRVSVLVCVSPNIVTVLHDSESRNKVAA
jgi:hypothetical protein